MTQMTTKELASEIRDAVATATHPCSLLEPLQKARDFITAIDSATPEEARKIERRHAAYRPVRPTENPIAALFVDDIRTLLAIVQQQAATIERQRTWSGSLQQADREIHELKESRDAAVAKAEELRACKSSRANHPHPVVGCSECIACLRTDLGWTKQRTKENGT